MPLFLVVDDTSLASQNKQPSVHKLYGYVGFYEEIDSNLIDDSFCKFICGICSQMLVWGATLKEISAEVCSQINKQVQREFSVVEWVDIKKEKLAKGSAEPTVEYYYEWNKIEKNRENE